MPPLRCQITYDLEIGTTKKMVEATNANFRGLASPVSHRVCLDGDS
jgi:hypothetical protein